MGNEWVVNFLIGTGKLFLNPLFYYSFFLCLVIGYRRVKQERKDFKIRVENGYFELKHVWPLGLLIGLFLSIITILSGVVIPFAAVIVMGSLTLLLSLTLKFRLLSSAYVIGITIFVLFFLYDQNITIPYLGESIKEMDSSLYPALAVIMGLLIIAEGILIRRNAILGTSPKLIVSNRGMTVGVHVSRRVWLVPLFLFVPGGELTAPFEWWPVFELGKELYVTPILVPFLIGFSQQVQGSLPKTSIRMNGERVVALGVIVLGIAVGSIWMPIFSIAAAAIAVLGRESIHYSTKMAEHRLPFYFSKRERGVLILGIIPFSPADKMALQVGEIITKVNGTPVNTEKELYEALQHNRAHCKLEVLDAQDQIRFVQRALFEGEHHELGILFVQEKRIDDAKAV